MKRPRILPMGTPITLAERAFRRRFVRELLKLATSSFIAGVALTFLWRVIA